MGQKRLHRSLENKMICGVCAGIADYINLDVTVVRLLFVIFGFFGPAIFVYLIAAMIMPAQ